MPKFECRIKSESGIRRLQGTDDSACIRASFDIRTMQASTMMSTHATHATLRWVGGIDGHLCLIDQTLLPIELSEIECRDVETVFEAIRSLRVRGAPAIGVAAAYGVIVGLHNVL